MSSSTMEPEEKEEKRIEVKMPSGITMQETRYGWGLFATRPFPKGSFLWHGSFTLVGEQGMAYLTIRHENGDVSHLQLDYVTHACSHPVKPGKRCLYTFDAFINHSCEPNSLSINSYEDELGGSYDTVATRDIAAGQEITCDYDLFEWDCQDKGINSCGCGTPSCRKTIHGFSHLSPELQLQLLPSAFEEVVEAWHQANPGKLFRKVIPPEGIIITEVCSFVASRPQDEPKPLRVESDKEGVSPSSSPRPTSPNPVDSSEEQGGVKRTYRLRIQASQDFPVGAVMFRNKTAMLPHQASVIYGVPVTVPRGSSGKVSPRALAAAAAAPPMLGDNVEWRSVELEAIWHSVNRGEVREYFGWDTFCNHSCDPNSESRWTSATEYLGVALRHIKAGEEITCDYGVFDDELDGTVFECQCGAPNCRKTIRG